MKSKINFYLKNRLTRDGKALIMLYISHPSFAPSQFRFSTGHSIDVNVWDKTRQRAVIGKMMPKLYKNLNASLDYLTECVSNFERKSELDGVPLSKDALKLFLEKWLHRSVKTVEGIPTLFAFISKFIEEKSKSPTVNPETIRQHEIAVSKLKAFSIQFKKDKLDWGGLENPSFITEFHNFLYAQGLAKNTVAKTTKELSTIFNAAKEQKYLSKEALTKFRVNGEDADAIALTDTELAELLVFDFSAKPRLEKVRDLFAFGCHTGLRFEDWTKINRSHITKVDTETGDTVTVIKFLTTKTRTLVHIPLFEQAQSILEKYDYQLPLNVDGDKPVSNQKTNIYLKEIFEEIGWHQEENMTKSIAGKRQTLSKRRCDLVSTHTARRTFITNLLARGMNYEIISKATGHKDFDSFKKYNKMTGNRAAVQMFNWVNEDRRVAVPRVAALSVAK